jgi:predicted MFS family arabinose efflux permease
LAATRPLVAVVAASAVGIVPAFLVSTQAIQIRHDLHFDEAGLGIVVAGRAAVAAFASVPLGRWAQRLGPSRALRLGAGAAAVVLLAIALGARTYASLAVLIAIAGTVHAFNQPAADLWVARSVRPARQGLAFGLKQASIPTASLVAGLAVPVIGVTAGWRWSFVAASGGAALVMFGIRSEPRAPERHRAIDRSSDVPLATMLWMAMGLAFASAPVNAFGAFLVSGLVEAGARESLAGWLFAFGAVIGILARVGFGLRADRGSKPQLPLVIGLLTVGAVGYLALATMSVPAMAVAAPLVFATAWGWPGIFYLSMVRANPTAPAAASGILNAGGFLGAVTGPLVFGALARSSYPLAWSLAAVTSVMAATTIAVGLRSLRSWATSAGRRTAAPSPRTALGRSRR